MRAAGSSAVMNQRHEALDSLDDFPTPPVGTRALIERVFPKLGLYSGPGTLKGARVWEPAAGRGIMAAVLREYGMDVHESDVHRYPDRRTPGDVRIGSFVGEGGLMLDTIRPPNFRHSSRGAGIDFVITNPPFRLGLEFALRAIREAEVVCLLLRSNWAEGGERYTELFAKHEPIAEAVFCERLPMVAGGYITKVILEDGKPKNVRIPLEVGGYDPRASSATAYSWFVWMRGATTPCRKIWIPPGTRDALTKPTDAERFAKRGDTALRLSAPAERKTR